MRLSNPTKKMPSSQRRFVGVSALLWVALAVSIGLLGVVGTYTRNAERGPAAGEPQSGLPPIEVQSPESGVAASALRLRWSEVPDAARYRLRIVSITGSVVAEGLPVESTWWSPPDELLPALVKGEYLWDVTAVDAENTELARSAQSSIRVLH